ncbi:MAG: hypothetical protein A3J47_01905 [Candidatus Yanofskybacteria bacterium RIFCSPHIGHO2_02_FULL_43_22]|uniref:Antitoxin Xre/MbcA/ParS-like toxin-binding domain-containing protein n=1 Tax=Candidatus Yanofskybacteria bacterium RIFCSPHIGHO2_02_FULL_43_22 TaxID=1802681 RepID=A0A1F8FMN9_9BACT|nr:MAG: hypothetical protein A3J47_01905 [Candidatus Yanofskybacteria bacterium RIFCSPHIGHO2_02_FULL_43_22]
MNEKELEIHRLLSHYFCGEDVKKWLNFPHPLLENKTPQSLIDEGKADAVLVLLESVRDGNPL